MVCFYIPYLRKIKPLSKISREKLMIMEVYSNKITMISSISRHGKNEKNNIGRGLILHKYGMYFNSQRGKSLIES